LVPTFVEENSSAEVRSWQAEDAGITTWIMSRVEVISAIARKQREQPNLAPLWDRAIRHVHAMASRWTEIWDADAVRLHAERIVMIHVLRAADALQLGAAIVAADGDPQSLELVTLDRRFGEAARREGFPVLGV
jgi:uncharacterized protein